MRPPGRVGGAGAGVGSREGWGRHRCGYEPGRGRLGRRGCWSIPGRVTGSPHGHLDWHVPSPDGQLVARRLSAAGTENSTVPVVDVSGGGSLGVAITNVRLPFLRLLAASAPFRLPPL